MALYDLIKNSKMTKIAVGEVVCREEDTSEGKRVGLLYEINSKGAKEIHTEYIEGDLEHSLGIVKFAKRRARKIALEIGEHFSQKGFRFYNFGEVVILERVKPERELLVTCSFEDYESINNVFGNPQY